MDEEPLTFEEVDQALRELERINRLTFTHGPTLAWLDRLAVPKGRPLAILDVACGHGDMLRRIRAWAQRRQVPVTLRGVDINPLCLRSAEAATPPEMAIAYELGDVFALPEEPPVDVILSSQFAHHLDEAMLARFIAWMEARARRGWLISDLHRHGLPHWFVRWWMPLMGFGRLVVNDGPISVARGFKRAEWRAVIEAAGVDPALVQVSWHVPFRWRVARVK